MTPCETLEHVYIKKLQDELSTSMLCPRTWSELLDIVTRLTTELRREVRDVQNQLDPRDPSLY